MRAAVHLARHLSEKSARYRDPVAQIDWSRLDTREYWLPEHALSLYGLPEYAALGADVRRRLSQYEFVNVVCCGLWLESVFLRRLAAELHSGMARGHYEYVLHQLREESGHSLMFLKAIEASALPLPAGAWRCPTLTDALARWLPAKGDLFWLAMVIGEHVPDAYNRWLRRQRPLQPVIEQMCTVHVVDEARHIAYARSSLEALQRERSAASAFLLRGAARLFVSRLAELLYFPPPAFYQLAGLADGAAWRRRALRNPARAQFVLARLHPTTKLLRSHGMARPA
jgi:hypothetical protein